MITNGAIKTPEECPGHIFVEANLLDEPSGTSAKVVACFLCGWIPESSEVAKES